MNFREEFLIQIVTMNYHIRSKNLLKDLQKQSLNYVVTPGVIPEQVEFEKGCLHSKFLSKLVCQRSLTKGDIGCALAHQETAKNLIHSNSKFGIVLEDDAELISNFDLQVLSEHLNSEKPIIISIGWIPGFAIGRKSEPYKDMVRLITPATCTFGYALNRSAAGILINSNKKIYDLPDWPIHTFGLISYLAVDTRWVKASTDPADSTIGERLPSGSEIWDSRMLSRLKLIFNFTFLVFISPFLKQRLSFKQILNSLILRDVYYNFGRAQAQKFTDPNVADNVIKPSKKIEMLAKLLSY